MVVELRQVDGLKRLVVHEGGHTLVGMLLDNTDPVHKVTIIPRGRAGGYTLRLKEGMTIGEVWGKCGFSDYSSFLRNFRKEYGMSPTSYRAYLEKK